MDQIAVAAKMAGEWWADRLSDEFSEARNAFSEAVSMRVEQELRGECYWDWFGDKKEGPGRDGSSFSENDYDPHYLLIEALNEALPDVPAWKLRAALPQKHTLDVTPDAMKPKEGYGNWTSKIIVPKVGHPASS